MKVRLCGVSAGPNGVNRADDIIDVSEENGRHMIENMYAVLVDAKGNNDTSCFIKESAALESKVETAAKKKVARKPRAKPIVSE